MRQDVCTHQMVQMYSTTNSTLIHHFLQEIRTYGIQIQNTAVWLLRRIIGNYQSVQTSITLSVSQVSVRLFTL